MAVPPEVALRVARGVVGVADLGVEVFDCMGVGLHRGPPELPVSVERSPSPTALKDDHDFLLQGGVFTEGLIDSSIAYKEEHEIDPVRLRSHPFEFHLYYDIYGGEIACY